MHTTSKLQSILNRLEALTQTSETQWQARCPVHDDQRPSLCIGLSENGRVLVRCQAGCETREIVSAIGLTMGDLFPERQNGRKQGGRIVASYDYTNENGKLLYQVVRLPLKAFRQRKPDEDGWTWKLGNVRRVLYRLPELLANDSREVFVVEGEKDVDRLREFGLTATCNAGGAGKWRGEYNEHLKDQHVVILPDNDAPGREHTEKIARSLAGTAASVKILELPGLPPKGDVSDWLDSGGTVEELQRLAKEEAKEWSEERNDQNNGAVSNSQGIQPNEAIDDPYRLARLIFDELPPVCYYRQDFYMYDPPSYRIASDEEIRAKTSKMIKAEFDRVNCRELEGLHEDGKRPTSRRVTKSLVANVVEAMKSLTILPDEIEPPFWINRDPVFPAKECLPTQSGILHPPSLVSGRECLLENTPDFFTTTGINYEFDPQSECPNWMEFICQLWPDDVEMQDTLQEIMGYLLLPDTSQQKMFLFVGPKRSGKGTIARIISHLVGPHNVAAPTLGSLARDFGLQQLLGKNVAVVGDARISGRQDTSLIVERLLSITGEDAQTINRKFKGFVTAQLKTRFLLLSNELPNLRDVSATLPSRAILIRFTESWYGREDHNLTERLLSELPGILRWALTGWQRLNERGYFVQPNRSRKHIENMEELASPITSFVRECCEIGAGNRVPVKILFKAWEQWCEDKGRKPGSEQMFGRDLLAARPTIERSRPCIEGKRVRCYENIRLIDDFCPD